MDYQEHIARRLAALLEQHQQEITQAWVEVIHHLPDSLHCEQSPVEVHACVARGFDAVVAALTTNSRAAVRAYLTGACFSSVQMGFDVYAVIWALLQCRNAVLPILRGVNAADSTTAQTFVTQIDVVLCWMLSDLTELYTASEHRMLQEQQARTTLVSDMVRIASASLDLDEVISHVADGIATAVGVQHCGFFLVDGEQGTITPKLDIAVPAVRSAASRQSPLSTSLPQPVTMFGALIRHVMKQKEPSLCLSVQADPGFDMQPLRELGFRSVLAIPFVVQTRVVAVAIALTLEDCPAFTEEQIELAHRLADAAALAIENARLYQQREQWAVTKERARLSREIHDDLAPTLGSLQLKASFIAELLSDGQVAQARADLSALQDMISAAYTDVREEIFSLRASVSPGMEFLPTLREYLDDYQVHYGMDVQLEIKDRGEVLLAGSAQVQVIRIIQEALTNVRKHARTNRASVCIERDNGHVRVSVQDSGQGFEPAGVLATDRQYIGLQAMCERAESIGGTLTLESQTGTGTTVVLVVPVAPN
ncbi:MAG: GAF domain-containing sensor histidine kinase [Anaerolineae bacterium]|nr:GAF domain-containing sensor histidine kinase [Anaerolineae bacterium]